MTSAREDMDEINTKLNALTEQINAWNELQYPLYDAKEKIISLVIQEEKLLKNSKWEIKFGYTNKMYLEYLGKLSDDKIIEVRNLCASSFHCRFELETDVSLEFNDNVLSLYFDDSIKITDVIKRYELLIDFSDLAKRMQQFNNELESLKNISSELGIKLI